MPVDEPGPSRRTVIRGTAALGAAGATAWLSDCTPATGRRAPSPAPAASLSSSAGAPDVAATSSTSSTSATSGAVSASTPPSSADWKALDRAVSGGITRPGESGYAAAHDLFDPRRDQIHPAAVAACKRAADVSAALAFARKFRLSIVSRSGGHSYLGASTTSGGIVIDTRPMSRVTYSSATKTAMVGAGAQLIDVYSTLVPHGRSIPGGSCPTVGIAGLTMGGGIGVVARAHGLTIDAVTALDVVTPDGQAHRVDAHHYPDLFWALRGGGGGDMAVVTAFHFSTFATGSVGLFTAHWQWSDAAAVVAGWQRLARTLPEQAWCNAHLEAGADGSLRASITGTALGGDAGSALGQVVRAVGHPPTSSTARAHSFLDAMLVEAGCSDGAARCHLEPHGSLSRVSFSAGSSVVEKALPASGIAAVLAQVWARAGHGQGCAAILDSLGGRVGAVAASSTAFPWRDAVGSIQWYAGLPNGASSASVRSADHWVSGARSAVSRWAPHAYVNYPDPSVTSPATYFGSNLSRLRQVKGKYDPHRLLRPPTGV